MNIEYTTTDSEEDPDYVPVAEPCGAEECECYYEMEPLNDIIMDQQDEINKLKGETRKLRKIILEIANLISREINN